MTEKVEIEPPHLGGRKDYTAYRCRVCGFIEAVVRQSPTVWPKGWANATFDSGPGKRDVDSMLCPPCAEAVRSALTSHAPVSRRPSTGPENPDMGDPDLDYGHLIGTKK